MKPRLLTLPSENPPICGLLNEGQVAQLLGISVASLRRWRLLRQGPKYIKVGSAVRYKPDDVTAWIDSRPSGGSEASKPASESAEDPGHSTTRHFTTPRTKSRELPNA
jgi:predicted DNA-binding transcriptional regulator AlpA